MKKKALKIIGLILLFFIALILALPWFLEGKIEQIIKNKVNNSINATFDFEEAKLSLIKSFPDAHVSLRKITLINHAPFEGDTLFASDEVALDMSIKELFKSADEPITIQKLQIDVPTLQIKVDAEENANYDIAKDTEESVETMAEGDDNFTFAMDEYVITNAKVIYDDLATGIRLELTEMNHRGTGDLSLDKSELDTHTDALVSFAMDSTNYLKNHKVVLDALVDIDLEESKYTFLENKALVNKLPLVFDGFVKVNDENQEVDITFETPSSDFKNFLAVIPEEYSKNIEEVQTTGDFVVKGQLKGIVDDVHIPTFDIKINSENASFKYPQLPKSVQNVYIDTEVMNTTGITEDTYVNIKKLSFTIDQDKFNLNSRIRDLMGNTKVNAHVDGRMNLANISKAYPVPAGYNLKGIMDADVTTAFDMQSLERKQYQNTKTEGKMSVRDFEYVSEELNNPLVVNNAALTFNPKTVTVNTFDGKTGNTDFKATGTLTNLLGFLFNEENIEGNFNLDSNRFVLNDFMVAESTEEENKEESGDGNGERVKIPSFLDCTINAKAGTVVYDNITLKNVSGTMVIKDEAARISNLTSDLFGGDLGLSGVVSTKGERSSFEMNLGMKNFNINESFAALELFQTLAPLARALQGKLNSDIKISGNLKDDLTPSLTTITGNLLAEVLSTKLDTDKAPLLSSLDSKLNFLNVGEVNFDNLKTALSFDNGVVQVKPFNLKYKDIDIQVAGSHTFDKQMQYNATLNVPTKYLGMEVNRLISQINDPSLEGLTIPVTANIGGSYTSPTVSTDLTSAVKNLTSQLVEIQKQKMVNKGKDKAKDLLSGVLKDDKPDTTATKSTGVKETLGTILNGNKGETTDSVKTESKDPVKNTAKSILGGLLGKKKKDTVN